VAGYQKLALLACNRANVSRWFLLERRETRVISSSAIGHQQRQPRTGP
jgi:hypothetical protein